MKTRLILIRKQYIWIFIVTMIVLLSCFYIYEGMFVRGLETLKPIYEAKTEENKVSFVCNVVWGNEYLVSILDILKDNNINITFAIGGEWATQNPELLKRIYDENHNIANHGHSHKKPTELGVNENKSEILKAQEAIKNIIGIKTTIFTPPYGDVSDKVTDIAKEIGYDTVMWSIDTIDWKQKDEILIIEKINKNIKPGAIILMHPTDVMVRGMQDIIDNLHEKNYEIVPVDSLIY